MDACQLPRRSSSPQQQQQPPALSKPIPYGSQHRVIAVALASGDQLPANDVVFDSSHRTAVGPVDCLFNGSSAVRRSLVWSVRQDVSTVKQRTVVVY